MRGTDIKKSLLLAYKRGLSPEQVANGQSCFQHVKPSASRKTQSFDKSQSPITSSVEIKVASNPIIETKPAPIPEQEIIRLNQPEPISTKITAMDWDIAKNRLKRLNQLISTFEDSYITSSLSPHSNKANKNGLRLERGVFHQLFGSRNQDRDIMAQLIAKEIDLPNNHKAAMIINGLIDYLEGLACFLKKHSLDFIAKPDLLIKYINYGRDEVYTLIKTISQKITTPNHNEIRNEVLFPTIASDIENIFGRLQPIEF